MPTPEDPKKQTEDSHSSSSKEIIYLPANYQAQEDEDEIDLLELWNILWNGRWFVAGLAFIVTLAAALVTLYVLPSDL